VPHFLASLEAVLLVTKYHQWSGKGSDLFNFCLISSEAIPNQLLFPEGKSMVVPIVNLTADKDNTLECERTTGWKPK
jgi:hypothetical protein